MPSRNLNKLGKYILHYDEGLSDFLSKLFLESHNTVWLAVLRSDEKDCVVSNHDISRHNERIYRFLLNWLTLKANTYPQQKTFSNFSVIKKRFLSLQNNDDNKMWCHFRCNWQEINLNCNNEFRQYFAVTAFFLSCFDMNF